MEALAHEVDDEVGPIPGLKHRSLPTPPRAHAETVARRYVVAYNDRDLEAMLAVQHEDIVSHPTRLAGAKPHEGHDGVRKWWSEVAAAGRWYHVDVREIRHLEPDRLAILGEIYDEGERISPWCVVIRLRDGLIIESRSYLSESELLERLGVIPNADAASA